MALKLIGSVSRDCRSYGYLSLGIPSWPLCALSSLQILLFDAAEIRLTCLIL